MSSRLRRLQSLYGGTLTGPTTLQIPTLGHSHRDRGTSIEDVPGAPDGLLVFVHNGSEADALARKDELLRALGEEPAFKRRHDRQNNTVGEMQRRAERLRAEVSRQAEIRRRQQIALAIWEASRDPRGTPVEAYLNGRRLNLTDEVAGTVIRWHPAGPWGQGRAPMMIAAMCDVVTGEVRAVHRTAFSPEGEKIDRKMFGPAAGSAIMLSPASDTVAVGEGIESCLSAAQLGYGPGVWAMGSAGAIGRLPVLDGVRRLILLGERDPASANAVSDCGHRWTRAGRAVSVVLPTTGKDLNDSLQGKA